MGIWEMQDWGIPKPKMLCSDLNDRFSSLKIWIRNNTSFPPPKIIIERRALAGAIIDCACFEAVNRER